MEWEVWAVRTATVNVDPVVVGSSRTADRALAPLTAWILRSARAVVLVDVGAHPDAGHLRPELGFEPDLSAREALHRLGQNQGDVIGIVLTHLHWDHASAVHGFTCPVFVSAREDAFCLQPTGAQAHAYDYAGAGDIDRVVHIGEGDAPFPGIRALELAGHTPGSIGVMVTVHAGRVLIAGDLVGNRDQLTSEPWRIPFVTSDADAARASLERIRAEISNSDVLPAHDMTIFTDGALTRVR
jgi:glyoxylase-like metal-dependent hydrolase (beta-lactamase superfamily II)